MVRPDYRDGRQGEEFRADGPRSIGRRGGSPNEVLQPQRMPPPPKRTKRRKPREGILSITSGVLSFVLVVLIGVLVLIGYVFKNLEQPGPLGAEKVVFMPRGTGGAGATEKLEAEGVIEGSWPFYLAAKLVKWHVQPGEFRFPAHVSGLQAIDILKGKPIPRKVTVPEGLTSQQIVQRLRDLKDDKGNELLTGEAIIPAEGSLMPATYDFVRGDSRRSILKKMATTQAKALEGIWEGRDPGLPIRSSYDLVTLASIVEKETGKADERPMVAAVFINRLNRHMKLQSDPTITYGIVGGQGSLGRPLRRSDIEKPTEYNTYAIEGLPKGPIANPGRAAMEAVAHPAKTKALYFVADGTGGHAFAETLAEHNRNVARWRQIEKEAKDKVAPDDEPPPEEPRPPRPPRRTEFFGPILRNLLAAAGNAPQPQAGSTWLALADIDPRPATQRIAPDMLALDDSGSRGATSAPARIKVVAGPAAHTPRAEPATGRNLQVSKGGTLNIDLGPSIDKRGWSVDGIDPEAEDPVAGPAVLGDDPPSNGSAASYPLSPGMLADLRARQKRYVSPSDLVPDLPQTTEGPPGASTVVAKTSVADDCALRLAHGKHVVAFDASEGTRLDPMRNRTFDLNTVKIVPDAVVRLIAVTDSSTVRSRLAALGGATGECAPGTRSAQKKDRVQVAALTAEHAGAASGSHFSNGFDASEGTPFDPLRNHAYDITTTQVVPTKPRLFPIPEDLLQPLPDPPKRETTVATATGPAGAAPMPTGPVSSHGFDASEGTRLDPLKDKTFDLNSAQTVPTKVISFDDHAAISDLPRTGAPRGSPSRPADRSRSVTARQDKPARKRAVVRNPKADTKPAPAPEPVYITEDPKT